MVRTPTFFVLQPYHALLPNPPDSAPLGKEENLINTYLLLLLTFVSLNVPLFAIAAPMTARPYKEFRLNMIDNIIMKNLLQNSLHWRLASPPFCPGRC